MPRAFGSTLAVVRVAVAVCAIAGCCLAAPKHYVITNDDVPPKLPTSASFYEIAANGSLTLSSTVPTGGNGIAAGFFGTQRVAMLQAGKLQCAFVSLAQTGQVVGIPIGSLKHPRPVRGSDSDDGSLGGIGLAVNANYLYAGFTTSNTIGTFQVLPGCSLQFVSDITVSGLQAGPIDGMAVHGDILVATYGDGSIESFNISAGVPVSNGDKQNSTASVGANWPSGVDITSDGRFAIFGDIATSTIVEISDISSGHLSPTVVWHLGANLSSGTVRLSPDETMLYVANTQSGQITAAFFNKADGTLSRGCSSPQLRGYSSDYAYLGTVLTKNNTGNGGILYVAEYGAPSAIGIVKVQVNGNRCTLFETKDSPVLDETSPGLLSIGVYPARSF